MAKCEVSNGLGQDDSDFNRWKYVPENFQYLRKWACKFGLRGLTVHFGSEPPLETLVSSEELDDLQAAYAEVAERSSTQAILEWCRSVPPETPGVDAKEEIRGLLLLFERLADRGIQPFADGRVKYVRLAARVFDWNRLPSALQEWKPWLKKFENLRTEADLYDYVQHATEQHLLELRALKELKERQGELLLSWCEANSGKNNPAENEAFQAEWLFVLLDFAESKISDL